MLQQLFAVILLLAGGVVEDPFLAGGGDEENWETGGAGEKCAPLQEQD